MPPLREDDHRPPAPNDVSDRVMTVMTTERAQVVAFLRSKPLQYLVHLKYLHLFPEDVTFSFEINTAHDTALLLSYDPELTSWDRHVYADSSRIYMPIASDPHAAQALITQVLEQTGDQSFVCKFCDPLTRDEFLRQIPLKPARTLISFTTSLTDPLFTETTLATESEGVIVSDQLDARTLPLYRQNGYSDDEITRFFENGSRSFSIIEHGEVIATCLIYHNFDDIWEIAGVHSMATRRRKGYARRVVAAALLDIHRQGWLPRYQTEATNIASIRLAESLGLTICLRFEHYQSV